MWATSLIKNISYHSGHGVVHEDNLRQISFAAGHGAIVHRRLAVLHEVHRAETRPFQHHRQQLAVGGSVCLEVENSMY